MRLIWSIGDERPEGGEKESTTVKSWREEMEREREGVIYQHRGFGKWREAGLNEEKREGRREREEQLPRERPVAARVSKAEVSSTEVYHPFPIPLGMACRPIFTIPRLPTIPFGFSLINSSNSRAGCLEFVEGVWERVYQSVCKSNHRKWIRYLLMTHSGNPSQSFIFASSHLWTYLKQKKKNRELDIWKI